MIRRNFFKLLGAIVAFPALGWRRVADYSGGWRTIRSHVNGFDCSARYRWRSDDQTVMVDWIQMSGHEGAPAAEMPFPWLAVDYDSHAVSFKETAE